MSRTLLPRGALSAYSAAVDHVLRVDESTCRAEGARISSRWVDSSTPSTREQKWRTKSDGVRTLEWRGSPLWSAPAEHFEVNVGALWSESGESLE